MSIMADCTCEKTFGYVFGDYSKGCPRHGSTAKWLEQQREQRAADLRSLREQALTRPAHGGYPDTDATPGVQGCSALGGRCEWPLRCEDLGRCAYGVAIPLKGQQ